MSLLHWFARKQPPAEAAPSSSGLSRPDAYPQAAAVHVGSRRTERTARRELLYNVVRECLTGAGVLSSSYKFKVLSLDGWGRQFLVMVDLAEPTEEPARRLSEIESLIGHAAKARHDIEVRAVYWRQAQGAALPVEPPTLHERVAPAAAPAVQAAASQTPLRKDAFQPIHEQELAAFRAAVAKGSKPQVPQDERSYTLLTGFENTELHDDKLPRRRALSTTQPGDLR